MKTKNNNLSKTVQSTLLIVALIFSSHMNAWSWPWNSSNQSTRSSSASGTVTISSSEGSRITTSTTGNGYVVVNTNIKTKSIPLDGGLSILLIGATAFGARKLRGNKK